MRSTVAPGTLASAAALTLAATSLDSASCGCPAGAEPADGVLEDDAPELPVAPATAVQADNGRRAGGGRGHGGPGGGETPLTGDTKSKVEAAVLAAYPNATVERTETNADGSAPYESHIKTSAGKELEVHVTKDFAVVDAVEHPTR